ncbi:ParB/Srx family N-terminal domain-containing protein [Cupriavidus basilensis]|uniref:ParB/Srx family N-terminal domain-containing protein n=1 Tax=Cupriavidus basilensis TaxID=68895 RepID=UPI0020C73D5F|nr:ParB/Srx family N-terminal domain-containing protein [Cupriavidus basilensis]
MIKRTQWAAVACTLATAALAACGGGGDQTQAAQAGGASTGGNGSNGGAVTQPAALTPLAGGSLYVGAVSFGDTVSVALDQPAAGQVTLRFLDSRFGLGGTLVGSYTRSGDTYKVTKLAAASADVPAALATAASAISFEFVVDAGVLSGALGQVPNLLAGGGALLQGHVSAANKGAQLSDVAGVYNYLRQAGTTAAVGQVKISANGTVRACAGAAYADNCAGGESGTLSADADQQRFPGAFAVTLGGSKIGRLFVASQDGQATLFVDEAASNADGSPRNGNWVLKRALAVAASAADGDWLCAEPELDDGNAATGRTRRNIVSIAGNRLAADNIATDVALNYNAAIGASGAIATGANGLISGTWQDTVAAQPQAASLALLPVTAKLAYQLRDVPGAKRRLQSVCTPLAAQTPTTTYLQAKAGDIVQVTLADLRPTQPAIGFDQIYYKLGRYAADPAKKFDDACEANGQNKASATTAASRLDNLASFTCTKAVGNKPADMKTMVIGPAGKPYLTDGHHTFTSVWEAADGGPQAKMWIKVQDNLATQDRATFFRTLRERKLMWLKDTANRPTTPAELPPSLGLRNGLGNDRYRSLVYFTRDIGYQQLADATEFTEFYWGDWLRQRVSLDNYRLDDTTSYLSAVRAAATAMVALAPADPVSSGKTAAALGGLTVLNETEFTALSQPVGSAKPGKLPYAVGYKATLAQ